jgi:hypothetical protein
MNPRIERVDDHLQIRRGFRGHSETGLFFSANQHRIMSGTLLPNDSSSNQEDRHGRTEYYLFRSFESFFYCSNRNRACTVWAIARICLVIYIHNNLETWLSGNRIVSTQKRLARNENVNQKFDAFALRLFAIFVVNCFKV